MNVVLAQIHLIPNPPHHFEDEPVFSGAKVCLK